MMSLCPFCGAYGPRKCELEEEAGYCPWEESGEYEREMLESEEMERIAQLDDEA